MTTYTNGRRFLALTSVLLALAFAVAASHAHGPASSISNDVDFPCAACALSHGQALPAAAVAGATPSTWIVALDTVVSTVPTSIAGSFFSSRAPPSDR